MKQPFTVRYKDEVVGAFVLGAIAIFVVLVVLTLVRRGAFEDRYTLHSKFTMGVGINTGAPVCIAGINIGVISAVNLNEKGSVTVAMSIKREHQTRIRTNSVASIMRLNPAVGDKFVNISTGDAKLPMSVAGDTLKSEDPVDLDNVLTQLTIMIESVEKIIRKVERGEGTIGSLINDRTTIDRANDLLASGKDLTENGNRLVTNLNNVSEKANKAIDGLPRLLDSLNNIAAHVNRLGQRADSLVSQLTEVLNETKPLLRKGDRTIDEADDLVSSLKKNWIIRSNLPKLPPDQPIYEDTRK